MKISIILTYYNSEKYVLNSLNSIYVQQEFFNENNIYNDVEVIIVNDASTDNSYNIVTTFLNEINKKNNNNFIWKHITNSINYGCGKARKTGIDNSCGEYIMFLDSDDYYVYKNFIYNIYSYINEYNDSDIYEFGLKMHDHKGESIIVSNETKELTNKDDMFKYLIEYNIIRIYAWTKVVKRWLTEKFPYSEERTYEDVLTIPKWVYNSNKITILPILGINYRKTNNAITSKEIEKRCGTVRAFTELCEYFKDNKKYIVMIYNRSMPDLSYILDRHNSDDPGFLEMMQYNTKMLKMIYS